MTSSRTLAAAAGLVSFVEAMGYPLPRLTSVSPDEFALLLESPEAVHEWAEFLTTRNSATANVSVVLGVTRVKSVWAGVPFEAFFTVACSEVDA